MPEIYYQLMTITGYQEIESQITKLKSQRPTLVARLKAARALGDLSENIVLLSVIYVILIVGSAF